MLIGKSDRKCGGVGFSVISKGVATARSLASDMVYAVSPSFSCWDFSYDNIQLTAITPEALLFNEVDSFDTYRAYAKNMEGVYEKRCQIERMLARPQRKFTIEAYNGLIKAFVKYRVDFLWACVKDGMRMPVYRERLICPRTRLSCRMRSVLMLLYALFPKERIRGMKIYLNEQDTPLSRFLSLSAWHLTLSEYLGPGIRSGTIVQGKQHEDITALSFADNLFELVISLDVLEHVPEYERGLREIYRLLSKGGIALLTVPFLTRQYEHTIRAKVGDKEENIFILPPEYHADPLSPRDILCYQYFGWKLLDELRSVGFSKVSSRFTWSLYHGILGTDIMTIVAQK